jgi:hypothetical protein
MRIAKKGIALMGMPFGGNGVGAHIIVHADWATVKAEVAIRVAKVGRI